MKEILGGHSKVRCCDGLISLKKNVSYQMLILVIGEG